MIRTHSRSRYKNPAVGSGAPFTPISLFTNSEQGAWFDPSDIATLFQDSSGTVPVTAPGDPVGRMLDKSGRGHHAFQATASRRPIYRTGAGLAWLEFDGVDDYMETDKVDLTFTDKVSLFAGVRKLLDTPTGMFIESSVDGSANNGTFAMTAPTTSVPGAYSFNLRGTVLISRAASVFTAPITNVVSCSYNIGGADFNTEVLPRVNGLVPTLSGSGNAGTGSFANQSLYIGRRGGATLPFTGNLYGVIVRGASTDPVTVLNAESYMATKSGITI